MSHYEHLTSTAKVQKDGDRVFVSLLCETNLRDADELKLLMQRLLNVSGRAVFDAETDRSIADSLK